MILRGFKTMDKPIVWTLFDLPTYKVFIQIHYPSFSLDERDFIISWEINIASQFHSGQTWDHGTYL